MTDVKTQLDFRASVILIMLCLIWGLHQVAIKGVAGDISPVMQIGLRSIIATLCLALWMAARRIPLFDRDGTWWPGIVAGLLFSFEFLLLAWGLHFTNASRSVIFIYTAPFTVAIGAHYFIPGENIGRLQLIGLICAFTGIVVAFSEALIFPTLDQFIGDVMIFFAAILWGATTVVVKATKLATAEPSKVLFYQLALAAILLPFGSMVLGEAGIVRVTPLAVGSIVFQGILIAFITYLAWFWLIRHYPASRLASFTFLTPLFGVLAGWAILDEPLSVALILSVLLVGFGIYLVNKTPKEPSS